VPANTELAAGKKKEKKKKWGGKKRRPEKNMNSDRTRTLPAFPCSVPSASLWPLLCTVFAALRDSWRRRASYFILARLFASLLAPLSPSLSLIFLFF
jgi:hypothetical protein